MVAATRMVAWVAFAWLVQFLGMAIEVFVVLFGRLAVLGSIGSG